MRSDYLKNALRFCCVIDNAAAGPSLMEQVETALKAGATLIRYHGSGFSPENWDALQALCRLCQSNGVPFSVRNHLLLAKALGADGLHLETPEESVESIRNILGPEAIIGAGATGQAGITESFDYLELTPFDSSIAREAAHPLIIAGIPEPTAARQAFDLGADGVTLDRSVFQSENPAGLLTVISEAGPMESRGDLQTPWQDEFGLIEKILKQVPGTRNGIIVPPGDDACLLSALDRPVISTDTQKEGVHFRRDWQSPEEIGEKAVSITLSDLAASYARPVSLFVNLSVPPRLPDIFMEALYRGIYAGLEKYGCSMGGGNISGGKELSLDLFAIGQGRTVFPKRSDARAGFDLYVTGPLGMARAGLEALGKDDGAFPELVKRFKHPRARFDAADLLAAHGVVCAMDVSDGLAGDAAHIATASGLTIELDAGDLFFSDAMLRFCNKYGHQPEALALAGGEDYELLFACPPEVFPGIKASLPGAARVGRCLPFQGRHVISPDISFSSYRHGA